MARGRLHASKIKEAKGIAKAIMDGIFKADEQRPVSESLKDHLGRVIDRVDPLELAIYGGLAYVGYELTKDWKGALIGPIALKLATSPSEAAAISGIIGLTTLGVMFVLPTLNLGASVEAETAKIKARQQEIIDYINASKLKLPEELPPYYGEYITEWVHAYITGTSIQKYEDWMKAFHPEVTEGPPSKPVPII